MLRSAAETNYGKRFFFTQVTDVDYIDAAWTVDSISANPNPPPGGGSSADSNEYFRNDQGKTRCYVEFRPAGGLGIGGAAGTTVNDGRAGTGDGGLTEALTFGIGGGFAVGRPGDAETLQLVLTNFEANDVNIRDDKENYMWAGGSLFVAATIEDNTGIVRLNSPILKGGQSKDVLTNYEELTKWMNEDEEAKTADIAAAQEAAKKRSFRTADGEVDEVSAATRRYAHYYGEAQAWNDVMRPAYQPIAAYVPTRSKFIRYGPVFASNLNPDAVGQLVIDQDDGFSPWEYGSSTLMIDAMQFKVNNQSSDVKDVESANITIENFPEFSLGESLGMNSNISSISISLGGQVTTTYQMRSFLRKFGELTKTELAQLSLFARRGGRRVLPQDMVAFIDKYRTKINAQFSGGGRTPAANGGGMSYE
jgi:hypothetical protein